MRFRSPWLFTGALLLSASTVYAQAAGLGADASQPYVPGELLPAGAERPQITEDEAPKSQFQFSGIITSTLSVGLDSLVAPPNSGQTDLQLHVPARMPNEAPTTPGGVWNSLHFRYGLGAVSANVALEAWNLSDAGFNGRDENGNAQAQQFIANPYLLFDLPDALQPLRVSAAVGMFPTRYGLVESWGAGRLNTFLFGETRGIGQRVSVELPVAEGISIQVEEAIQGRPRGQTEARGAAFVAHAHAGLLLNGQWLLAGHVMRAFSQDVAQDPATNPWGAAHANITIGGGEVRVLGAPWGDAYLGYSRTTAANASALPNIVSVFGREPFDFTQEYFGTGASGYGSVDALHAQYSFLLSRLPASEQRRALDLTLTAFALAQRVNTDAQKAELRQVYGQPSVFKLDDRTKWKAGAEAIYYPWSIIGASARYDRVVADTDDDSRTFASVAARLHLRTEALTHETFTLGYYKYFYGANVIQQYSTSRPDEHAFSLSGVIWW